MLVFSTPLLFDWDQGNEEKNEQKHKVTQRECENIFENKPLIIAQDLRHSQKESRYQALGKTNEGRLLSIILTMREKKIRIISARDMNKKERSRYE